MPLEENVVEKKIILIGTSHAIGLTKAFVAKKISQIDQLLLGQTGKLVI